MINKKVPIDYKTNEVNDFNSNEVNNESNNNSNKINNYNIINDLYEKNLKEKGVKKIQHDTDFYFTLEYLFLNLCEPIYIENIKKYVSEKGIHLNGGDSLQVRHLGLQYGYNILKGGDTFKNNKIKKSHYMLVDLENTYNVFIKDKRKEKITDINWVDIKLEYDNKCVNCGSTEDEPLRWDKNKITKLSQGHMDPRKSLAIDNVIPQCAICNQQYKNKAIFNKRGYVIDFIKEGF